MNAAMRAQWATLLARIDALSRRERLMVLAAALVVVGVAGETFLLAPQRAHLLQVQRDAARERTELGRIESQLAELKGRLASDPDEVPRLRLRQLTAELSELNAGFQRLEQSLVPPDQMARLLEQVMRRTPGISVVRLQTLVPTSLPDREAGVSPTRGQPDGAATAAVAAVEAVGGTTRTSEATVASPGATTRRSASTPAASGPDAPLAAQPALWRHGVELTVRGSYVDLLRYLDAVERLPVRVYFGRAVLDATQYPEVDLRLTVYTLGMDRSWLAL